MGSQTKYGGHNDMAKTDGHEFAESPFSVCRRYTAPFRDKITLAGVWKVLRKYVWPCYNERVMWMMSMLCTVLAAIVALGLVNRLGLSRRAEVIVGLVLVGFAQKYLLFRAFHASIIAPETIPPGVLLLFLYAEAFLLAAAPLTVVWWGLRACHARIRAWVPLGAAVALGALMMWQGFRQPPVREHEIALPGLPQAAEGLRVAVLADMHLDSLRGRDWCKRLVQRVNALKPDLVVLTGDQEDGSLALCQTNLAPLAGLKAPLGRYVVTGNHEWFFDTEALLATYRALGLRVLDGSAKRIGALWLMGLPDARSLTRQDNQPLLRRLVAACPTDAFPVLLCHKPGIAPEADALGVRLQLSGHTHGGQLPGVAALIARFNGGFVRGWYALPGGLRLFVAPGSGVWSGFPFRIYAPELTLLTLRRAV